MLEPILNSTRARVSLLKSRPAPTDAAVGQIPPRGFAGSLSAPGLGVIAEIKRRSPSAGSIAPELDPGFLGETYARGGAAAISVLTEPDYFGGSLDDLRVVAAVAPVPLLRKDFILDRIQVDEARSAGADAVLLIAAILDDSELRDLQQRTQELGMDALVETHDPDEVRRAVAAGATVIGINNRDLSTFQVDLTTAERLRHLIPPGVMAVAESGIRSPADATRMRNAGFDAVLVGQAAAQADDPGAFIASLAGVG